MQENALENHEVKGKKRRVSLKTCAYYCCQLPAGLKYIWTGGFRRGLDWNWASRNPFEYLDWSHTGG